MRSSLATTASKRSGSGTTSARYAAEELAQVVVHVDRARGPAVVVEDAGAEHQRAHEVGALERREQRDRRAIAVAEQVRGAADDLLEEGDRVVGHPGVADRALDVGGAAVAAAVGAEHAEVLGEPRDVAVERARVGQPGVQEHERVARAVVVVVELHDATSAARRTAPGGMPITRLNARAKAASER